MTLFRFRLWVVFAALLEWTTLAGRAEDAASIYPTGRSWFTVQELKDAKAAAHRLHQPLAWIDGNPGALNAPPTQEGSEDEITQMAIACVKDRAVIVFVDVNLPMGDLPAVVRDQEFFQMDDGPMEGGHHFYVPKIGFTDAELTTALGRVAETQMADRREAAIASALTTIADNPKADALLSAPVAAPASGASPATVPSTNAPATNSPATSAPAATYPDFKLQTPFHTKKEWIVGTVCRNTYEMLSVIANRAGDVVPSDRVTVKKVADSCTAYEVSLQGNAVSVNVTLRFPASIWASQAYLPFCQAAATQLKVLPNSAPSVAHGSPLTPLLDFTDAAIQSENNRVSDWLTTDPANERAQEQAALVLGTLAMKENSGWFWDPRNACNHLAAHLTVARFWQATLGSGRKACWRSASPA